MTGRSLKYKLYPLSTGELTAGLETYEKNSKLEEQLIFGGYPYLQRLSRNQEKKDYLKSLVQDYLFKDVLELQNVSVPENLRKLAILLAFQVGSEVSLNELANNLGIDVKTVSKYLSLLKQGLIISELGAFSKNLRKEVVKSKKYYFWDLGIRNALIDQFLPTDSRTDVGQLWENFLIIERLKKDEYQRSLKSYYFWRTYEQAEIDWVEVEEEKIKAFEFKWKKIKSHTPKAFKQAYKAEVEIISVNNYLNFVL